MSPSPVPPVGIQPAGAPARTALLAGLVDYAGLFPPAALPLGPVAETYARERAGGEAWMLGRLVVPATTLSGLSAHRDHLSAVRPWPLVVLGHTPEAAPDGTVRPDAWLDAAERTLADAADADRALGTVADRFELRLPVGLALDPDALVGVLGVLVARLARGAAVALEVPFLARPETTEPAAHAVAEAHARAGRDGIWDGAPLASPTCRFALKLRCGGETPETVPSVEALAAAMTAARRAGVAFKATAGLHEPLRHPDETVGAVMHGFVNVFGGAALAARHGLDADSLAEILDSGDAADWRLGDTLAWRSLTASAGDVARARAEVALSFGSCSFDDPRDGLRALGWL